MTLDEVLNALAQKIAQAVAAELTNGGEPRSSPAEDRLVDAPEAARLLGVTPTWLRRHASRLPFAKRLGRRTVRFSVVGIQRYLKRGA